MIWGETREQRAVRLCATEPRPWFAWHPVDLTDGRKVWLETVLRRRFSGYSWWLYEPLSPTSEPEKTRQGGGDA